MRFLKILKRGASIAAFYEAVRYIDFATDRKERWTGAFFDLATDPAQLQPIRDAAVEQRLMAQIAALMEKNDAPPEAFLRLDLPVPTKQ